MSATINFIRCCDFLLHFNETHTGVINDDNSIISDIIYVIDVLVFVHWACYAYLLLSLESLKDLPSRIYTYITNIINIIQVWATEYMGAGPANLQCGQSCAITIIGMFNKNMLMLTMTTKIIFCVRIHIFDNDWTTKVWHSLQWWKLFIMELEIHSVTWLLRSDKMKMSYCSFTVDWFYNDEISSHKVD